MTPKARQVFYALGTVASGVLTLLTVFQVIESETAVSLNNVIAALGGLFGTAAAGTAAVVTSHQIKNGVLSPASTAVERTVTGLQDVAKVYSDLVAQVTEGLQRVQSSAESIVNVALPDTSDNSIEVTGSLADAVRNATQRD